MTEINNELYSLAGEFTKTINGVKITSTFELTIPKEGEDNMFGVDVPEGVSLSSEDYDLLCKEVYTEVAKDSFFDQIIKDKK